MVIVYVPAAAIWYETVEAVPEICGADVGSTVHPVIVPVAPLETTVTVMGYSGIPSPLLSLQIWGLGVSVSVPASVGQSTVMVRSELVFGQFAGACTPLGNPYWLRSRLAR